MTIQNREAFLERIAANLGRPRRTKGVRRPEWSVKPQQDVLRGYTQDELAEVLEAHCKVIHTAFKKTTMANLHGTIKETIEEYGGRSIIAGSDERVQRFGLDALFAGLAEDGCSIHLWDGEKGKENMIFAEKADIGISISDITLAESGTVTLLIDRKNGRSISLMPESFIALIPKSTLVPRMTQATETIHETIEAGGEAASCVSFITGPSNSADIEMNLIVGVHGPIRAAYILIEDC